MGPGGSEGGFVDLRFLVGRRGCPEGLVEALTGSCPPGRAVRFAAVAEVGACAPWGGGFRAAGPPCVGGCLLTMGGVTMFAQNITAGRGYIAMAAATLGAAHPLGVVAGSAFFGFAQSMANMLQNSSISSQLTMALPYLATILALAIYNFSQIRRHAQ